MSVKVNIFSRQKKISLPTGTKLLIRKACNATLEFEKFGNSAEVEVTLVDDEEIREIYREIALPKRATAGSAGYDFYSPVDFSIAPGESIKIPTGIRVEMDQEWVLKCYPRSGLGFKYRLQLNIPVARLRRK